MKYVALGIIFLSACKNDEVVENACTGSYVQKNGSTYYRSKSKVGAIEPEYRIKIFGSETTEITASGTSYHQILKTSQSSPYTSGEGIVVAVIDTGANLSHVDLKDSLWVNTNEIPSNGIDDDHNGYVDDIHGYNFVANNGNPADDNGHGSHVSGIIAGKNGIGIAPNAKIMVIKAMDAYGTGDLTNALNGVRYAISNGAHIINASWGTSSYSSALRSLINEAYHNNIAFVAAAGNETRNNDSSGAFPATYSVPNVVSVASTSHSSISASNANLSLFSNFGTRTVPVAMPGSSIQSTWVNGGYKTISGTSMASPMMAGLIALAASLEKNAGPLSWISHSLCTNPNSNLNTSFSCVSTTDILMNTLVHPTQKSIIPNYQRVNTGGEVELALPPSGFIYEIIGGSGYVTNGNKIKINGDYAKVQMRSLTNSMAEPNFGIYFAGNPEPHTPVECE